MSMFRMMTSTFSGAWSMILTQGICLVLFGILVLAVPEILIYMIGFLFLIGGGLLIALSLSMRRQNRDASRVFEGFRDRFFRDF